MEDGVVHPSSTNYEVIDGQVNVPSTASERQGIQPVIQLTANGSERAKGFRRGLIDRITHWKIEIVDNKKPGFACLLQHGDFRRTWNGTNR